MRLSESTGDVWLIQPAVALARFFPTKLVIRRRFAPVTVIR